MNADNLRTPLRTALGLCATLLLSAGAQAGLLDNVRSAVAAPAATAPAAAPAVTAPVSGDLLSMVGSGLGINQAQASGGLGALFKVAQGQLGANDFGTIASAVPNMDQLLGAAPAAEPSAAGGLLSQAGSLGKALGGASYLNSAFGKLGLSPDLIGPMANIAAQYLQGTSPQAAALLQQVTGGLM